MISIKNVYGKFSYLSVSIITALMILVILSQVKIIKATYSAKCYKANYDSLKNINIIHNVFQHDYIGKNINEIVGGETQNKLKYMPAKILILFIPYESCAPCVEKVLKQFQTYNKSNVLFIFDNYPKRLYDANLVMYNLQSCIYGDETGKLRLVYDNITLRKNLYVLTVIDKLITSAEYFDRSDSSKLTNIYNSIAVR